MNVALCLAKMRSNTYSPRAEKKSLRKIPVLRNTTTERTLDCSKSVCSKSSKSISNLNPGKDCINIGADNIQTVGLDLVYIIYPIKRVGKGFHIPKAGFIG